jgi:hypothetical protein
MTKREIIYQALEKLSIQSDDSRINEELLSSFIDTKRSMLFKQQYSKSAWKIPASSKQELCLTLSLVNKVSGYSCAGKILSTVSIPSSIKVKGKEGPLLVRKEDGSAISLSVVAIERIPYLFENKYLKNITYCAVDSEGKLIIISNNDEHKFLKNIRIVDVFENPGKALPYKCGYDSSIDEWDVEYPCESAMTDTIVDLIVRELTRTLNIPVDDKNDSTDDRR